MPLFQLGEVKRPAHQDKRHAWCRKNASLLNGGVMVYPTAPTIQMKAVVVSAYHIRKLNILIRGRRIKKASLDIR